MKRPLLLLLLVTAAVTLCAAEETVLRRFTDRELKGAITGQGESAVVSVENKSNQPLTSEVLSLEAPGITSHLYAVMGEVSYRSVAPAGYLEMWSHFDGGRAYFSRTLGETGPMGKLQESSKWRDFQLPFNSTGAAGAPRKLVVNVQLPGAGYVELRNLRLVQFPEPSAAGRAAWWPDRTAGLIGGIGGAVIGCLGTAMEWLARRGRARSFVRLAAQGLIVLGAIAAAVGIYAVTVRQPYGVWYPLLLAGALCVLIFPARLRRYESRYQQSELRRMSALDAEARA